MSKSKTASEKSAATTTKAAPKATTKNAASKTPAAKKPSAPKKSAAPKAAATGQEVITGTTSDLIETVLLNGVPLEGPHLSMMLKYGIVKKVDELKANPGTRGKAANVLELRNTDLLNFTRKVSATAA